jgi:hypothetical protein
MSENPIISEKNINTKKIKYKLKKGIKNDNINLNKEITTINCSYDFLVFKFGNPTKLHENTISYIEWIVNIKTSNDYNYIIIIGGYVEDNDDKSNNNITDWKIIGENYEYLNYDKLVKLIDFEYKNFLKKKEKLEKKNINNSIKNDKLTNTNGNYNKKVITNPIDENKYNELDINRLSDLTDDDLACVLFTRFKNSNNQLIKEALIIHRTLIKSDKTINITDNKNFNQIDDKNSKTYNKTYIKKDNKNTDKLYIKKPINKIKRNKSKYNNKKESKNKSVNP